MQKVQYIKDPLKPFTTTQLRKDKFNLWVEKMTTKLKEMAASQWTAPILLGLLLSFSIYDSRQKDTLIQIQNTEMRAQRELLIILKTQKEDQDKIIDKSIMDQKEEAARQQVWREKMNVQMAVLQQIRGIAQGQGSNNHAQTQ